MVREAAAPEPSPQKQRVEEQEPVVVRPVEEKREEPRRPPRQTPPADAEIEKGERLSVAFWLGGRHAAVGDLNDGAEGLARYYESRLPPPRRGGRERPTPNPH